MRNVFRLSLKFLYLNKMSIWCFVVAKSSLDLTFPNIFHLHVLYFWWMKCTAVCNVHNFHVEFYFFMKFCPKIVATSKFTHLHTVWIQRSSFFCYSICNLFVESNGMRKRERERENLDAGRWSEERSEIKRADVILYVSAQYDAFSLISNFPILQYDTMWKTMRGLMVPINHHIITGAQRDSVSDENRCWNTPSVQHIS